MATKKSSSRSKKGSTKKQSGSAAGNSRNPSQENKGQVGDEGHARTRPSETRSVVEREGHEDDGGNGGRPRTEEYKDYSVRDPKKIEGGPDVLIDVPVVKVDEIDLEVDDVHAQVAVLAEVRQLVKIGVGAEAHLDKVELKIEGARGAGAPEGEARQRDRDPRTRSLEPRPQPRTASQRRSQPRGHRGRHGRSCGRIGRCRRKRR